MLAILLLIFNSFGEDIAVAFTLVTGEQLAQPVKNTDIKMHNKKLLIALLLPCIPQGHGSIKHGLASLAVFSIRHKIAVALKLESVFRFRIF